MDAVTQQIQAAEARVRLSNEWIIKVDRLIKQATDQGWPNTHCPELVDQPPEVQDRVMGYFQDIGYQAYRGFYGDYELRTIWFSSHPPKKKQPGVFSQLITRLFGGQHG